MERKIEVNQEIIDTVSRNLIAALDPLLADEPQPAKLRHCTLTDDEMIRLSAAHVADRLGQEDQLTR